MAEVPLSSATALSADQLGIATDAQRAPIERTPVDYSTLGQVQRKLSPVEVVWGNEAVRKFTIVLVLLGVWQLGAAWYNNTLAFPTMIQTHKAFWEDFWPSFKSASPSDIWIGLTESPLISSTGRSIKLLSYGYVIGVFFAAVLSVLATFTRIGRDLLETLTSMFSPLPAIALVPLALIWFGLGNPKAMIFVLVHSVLWPVALNMHSGFRSSGTTLRMVGQNYGLGPVRFVWRILIPASFGAILTGLKIGWAFAWRTLIAAELVFGANGDQGGLGWYIFEHKNMLDTPAVFAGLLMVIVIGLAVENLVFRTIEYRTIRKWGMAN
jgi:NitT/TauT family transport system permease protein